MTVEPSAAVPWSVVISVGASLIAALVGIVVKTLNARLSKLERDVGSVSKDLHDLTVRTTEDRGQLLWLKASDAQRRDDYLPRELALQRLEQQDHQLARIEAALERKISRPMPAVRDPREEPEPEPLPPMRPRLPSSRGR